MNDPIAAPRLFAPGGVAPRRRALPGTKIRKRIEQVMHETGR
jgi:hypothetical protein